MQKIIFCEKNKELLKKVEELFNDKELVNNTHCELIIGGDDIFKAKEKYRNALIVTTSNPDFSMGGGLDGLLKEKYPEQCKNTREFKFTKDLFFTVTVDKDFKSSRKIVQRALLGCYFASRKNDIIITGLGTGIGGLSIDDFLIEFKGFINADFRSADFSSANFISANFISADFSYANFISADFSYASFSYANFSYANFSYAYFSYASFSSASFSSADFRYANFISANFCSANFSSANFSSANFSSANFRSASFSSASFSSANFRSASFSSANFSSANFSSADFRYANFRYANFSSANFRYANFSSANFRYANFSSADFSSADFSYAKFSYASFSYAIFNYRITPEEGKFIGWKKAKNKILKLEIQDAKNVSGGLIGRKLRTDKVKVLEIQELDGTKSKEKQIISDYTSTFEYKVGKIAEEPRFIKDDKIECTYGIHFFITRDEAVRYS